MAASRCRAAPEHRSPVAFQGLANPHEKIGYSDFRVEIRSLTDTLTLS